MVRIRGDHHRATKILTHYRTAEISAYNSPKSTVISAAEDEAYAIAQELGEDATVIPVAVAAHSAFVDAVVPIVADAADSLAAAEEPAIAVFSPSVGRQVRRADLASAQFWAQHVRRPVRFHQTLMNAVESCTGPVVVVNVGPGASLAALAREAGLDDIAATVIVADEQGTISEQSLLAACAEAVASGVPWQGREPDYPRRITLPRYPFDRRRFWPKRRLQQVASRSSHNTELRTGFTTLAWRHRRPRIWLVPQQEFALSTSPRLTVISILWCIAQFLYLATLTRKKALSPCAAVIGIPLEF